MHVFGDTSSYLNLFEKGAFSKTLFSRLTSPLDQLLLETLDTVTATKHPVYLDCDTIRQWFQDHDDPTPPQLNITLKYYKSRKREGTEFFGVYFQREL